ncbi:hypothetical protein CSW62_20750 [Caulobacter sp. FWC2]|nr:hypothetical protein CSW62_20750 [Caulobacter sp. FWC2]
MPGSRSKPRVPIAWTMLSSANTQTTQDVSGPRHSPGRSGEGREAWLGMASANAFTPVYESPFSSALCSPISPPSRLHRRSALARPYYAPRRDQPPSDPREGAPIRLPIPVAR